MTNFAEQISRAIDRELEDVEKHCIRPLQVRRLHTAKEIVRVTRSFCIGGGV